MGAVLAAGCADKHPSTRILFKDATVNGQPERLALDTGSAYMTIFADSAKRADMQIFLRASPTVDDKFQMVTLALAEPARINLGGGEFSVQPIVGNLSKFDIMVAADGVRIDGLISWPDVRDNVLVFDGPQRKITGVGTVSDEIKTNWLPFPIGQDEQLTLKTQLANGQLGTILVDTGAYFGVALPPEQWKAWRAAHPQAPSGFLIYVTPGVIGEQSVEEAWADEIQLGSLTLTDVPVHLANKSEMHLNNYAGTLGLYALARLNLVLDGKNNMAYVQARPPPGPYYPGIARPGIEQDATSGVLGKDWSIEGKVALNPSHQREMAGGILLNEANRKYERGDHAGALAECSQAIDFDAANDAAFTVRGALKIKEHDEAGGRADLNHALELNPANIWAYTVRAQYKFQHGDPDGAIADCSHAIDLDANYATAYLERGAIKQAQNNNSDALADYERVCTLLPNDGLAQLYRELLQRWAGRPPRNLTQELARISNPWQKALGDYLSGNLSEPALLALAEKSGDTDGKICQAEYFAGFVHYLNQDQAGARVHWQKCMDTKQTDQFEYAFAQTLLKFLDSMGKQ